MNIIAEALRFRSLEELAAESSTVEEFIQRTDGYDVLYRGHYDTHTPNHCFMTDYVGHAAEYASDDGRIDAFAYSPDDVLYYDNERFNEWRSFYRKMDNRQIAAAYKLALVGNRFGGDFYDVRDVIKVIRSDVPYDEISGNFEVNNALVPLLQKYARDTHGKNIIAFHGSDYADYGGQTEYVVADVSKLMDLRTLYARVHS